MYGGESNFDSENISQLLTRMDPYSTLAILVSSISKFKYDIRLEFREKQFNLKSITSLMTLGAGEGDQIKVFRKDQMRKRLFVKQRRF